jgi:hypothetical protein
MNLFDNNNLVEYSENGTNFFSGGISVKNIIIQNNNKSNINSLDKYERFSDLYVPIGLQVSKYNHNKYYSNTIGGTYNNDKYEQLIENVKGNVGRNSLNKTKKIKKNK